MSNAKRLHLCAGLLVLAACGSEPTAPAAFKLAFFVQPTTAPTNARLGGEFLPVFILDSYGRVVPTATDTVTVAFGANPGGAGLVGPSTVTAISGVAYFHLSIDGPGEGYTLVATARNLDSATTAAFSVYDTLAPPAHVENLQLASTTLTMGGPGVAYTADVVSTSVGTMAGVYIQAYIDQGGAAIHGAGGAQVSCGAPTAIPRYGDLPPGTCPFRFTVNVPNTGGSLVAGAATARFELRQNVSLTQNVLLDSVSTAVTLIP
ncbi:MAG TPA: hypothetical protein VGU74_02245 [Gemmatimonadales bacterium]|nr:hypothetical protein [Gemmatimonadales bacterium]